MPLAYQHASGPVPLHVCKFRALWLVSAASALFDEHGIAAAPGAGALDLQLGQWLDVHMHAVASVHA